MKHHGRFVMTRAVAQAMAALNSGPKPLSHKQIAAIYECAQSTVQRAINNIHHGHDFGPGLWPIYAPPPDASVSHTRDVLRADAGGFRWLHPAIAARFYALERTPANKSWWRAA